MSGVLSLAPELALTRFGPWLRDRDAAKRELAVQGGVDCGECVLSNERALLLRALGLHRSDAALDAMLEFVTGDNDTDAVRALAARRYQPAVRARVSEAVSKDRHLARSSPQPSRTASWFHAATYSLTNQRALVLTGTVRNSARAIEERKRPHPDCMSHLVDR